MKSQRRTQQNPASSQRRGPRRGIVLLIVLLITTCATASYLSVQVAHGSPLKEAIREVFVPFGIPVLTALLAEMIWAFVEKMTAPKPPWTNSLLEETVHRDLLRRGVLKPEIIAVSNFEALDDHKRREPCKVIAYDRKQSGLLFALYLFANGECDSVEIGSVPTILRTFREGWKQSTDNQPVLLRDLRRAFERYVEQLPYPLNDNDLVGADFLWNELARYLSRKSARGNDKGGQGAGEARVSL